MSHENFTIAKRNFINNGFSEEEASQFAAASTGETDGSVDLKTNAPYKGWKYADWFAFFVKQGLSKDDAQFRAGAATGEIDLKSDQVDY